MKNLSEITIPFRGKLVAQAYKPWLTKESRVLDVGCGNGVLSDYLASLFKLKIVGTDIENYLIRNISFVEMTSKKVLPKSKIKFDVMMFNDTLHHMNYKTQEELLLQSLYHAKKILIFEISPSILSRIFDFVINKLLHPKMEIPFTFRTREEWIKLFSSLNASYTVIPVRKPLLYPFKHIAFKLEISQINSRSK